jgi:hypothetical protein
MDFKDPIHLACSEVSHFPNLLSSLLTPLPVNITFYAPPPPSRPLPPRTLPPHLSCYPGQSQTSVSDKPKSQVRAHSLVDCDGYPWPLRRLCTRSSATSSARVNYGAEVAKSSVAACMQSAACYFDRGGFEGLQEAMKGGVSKDEGGAEVG